MQPIPGNPWPHDMVLTITNDSDNLLELLWIRQALNLNPPGDDWPPLLTDVEAQPAAEAAGAQRAVLSEAWGRIWRAASEHAGNRPSHDLLDEARTASTPARRAELLAAFRGPSWDDEHDETGFGEPYAAWREEVLRTLIGEHHLALEQTPERQSLPALIEAWHKGLQTIVTIPSAGTYTRTLGKHGLLTTADTRADPTRYTDALRTFHPQ